MVSIVKRNRILKDDDDLFTQNAWDDTEWTEQMVDEAEMKIQRQKLDSLNLSLENIEEQVGSKWDHFYQAHGDKFFKDRKWIFAEFPEILDRLSGPPNDCLLFEVGCGVGNAVAHIINQNCNPKLRIFCCDLSQNAIRTLKSREFYLKNENQVIAFQADITSQFELEIRPRIPEASLDFITLIFTLSAMRPEVMQNVVNNLASLLKKGGMILFRDYARYDLTQLRFKPKSYLAENYYVRADGTTSYFFTKDTVRHLFTSAGLQELELKEDNRTLVNRLKSVKMCRCWLQAKYVKMEPR